MSSSIYFREQFCTCVETTTFQFKNKIYVKMNGLPVHDKKQKRHESRKRKIEAFAEICLSNDRDKNHFPKHIADSVHKDAVPENGINLNSVPHTSCNFDHRYQELKTFLKEYKKSKEKGPSFSLVGPGVAARYPLSDTNGQNALYVQDLQHLLLTAVGCSLSYDTQWCHLVRCQRVSHVVYLTFDGLCASHLSSITECQNFKDLFCNDAVEFFSPVSYGSSFIEELLHVPLSLIVSVNSGGQISCTLGPILKPLRNVFPIDAAENMKCNERADAVPRTHLLLSLPQMFGEGYPMPLQERSTTNNYCFTKDVYNRVTETSPIFAVDCEMCATTECSHELTRISIADEHLDVLYDSLVKPRNKIVNYLTQVSGITKSMLKGVTTRLEDVQRVVRQLLPADAILCGQSLNFDLHAMKMMHPYVIDTSVIYNITGFRSKKSSLKLLSKIFLQRDIQCSSSGHDSVEDCVATMQLVNLKLSKGLRFGDVLLGGHVPLPSNKAETETKQGNATAQTTLLECILDKNKSLCVLGSREKVSQYTLGIEAERLTAVTDRSVSKLVERTAEIAIQHDVTLAHIPVKKTSHMCLTNVKNAVENIYNACADKALLIVVFTAESGNGVCMVKVKSL